jgi:hypothetical protein
MLPPPKDLNFEIPFDEKRYLNPEGDEEDKRLLSTGEWDDELEEEDEPIEGEALNMQEE